MAVGARKHEIVFYLMSSSVPRYVESSLFLFDIELFSKSENQFYAIFPLNFY